MHIKLPSVVANPDLSHYPFMDLVHTVGIMNLAKKGIGIVHIEESEYRTNVHPGLCIYAVHEKSSAIEIEYDEWQKSQKNLFGGDHYIYWREELVVFKEALLNNRAVLLKWLNLLAQGVYPIYKYYSEYNV